MKVPSLEDLMIEDDEAERPEFECDLCGEQIHDGEYYYELLGKKICSDCIEESRLLS